MGIFSFLNDDVDRLVSDQLPAVVSTPTTEVGRRPTPENSVRRLYGQFWQDPELRQTILDIRSMDKRDGRVKKIHNRTARDAIKGGIIMSMTKADKRVQQVWKEFSHRIGLNNPMKLKSDARGMFMEGSLPYQWAIGKDQRVAAGIRMPSETIVPIVADSGQFKSVEKAYRQVDPQTGRDLATFALYQLTVGRMDPDNYDDLGCMGRPYLDASRTVWKQLTMTEEDLVVRRRTRAPLRMAHVLEGATEDDIEKYREQVENDQGDLTTDFYLNRKGSVSPVQGDANLDQIADVGYLLDSFFSGAPAPKGLFGYVGDLSRDILEDLKRDYYEEVDALQDAVAWVYTQGFMLDLLLKGINPLDHSFEVKFAERRTETANQSADLALKWQALGMPQDMIFRRIGEDPASVREMLIEQSKRRDPYPEPGNIRPQSKQDVKITPGNAPKGESSTSVTARS